MDSNYDRDYRYGSVFINSDLVPLPYDDRVLLRKQPCWNHKELQVVINIPEQMVILKWGGVELSRTQTDEEDWLFFDPTFGVLLALVKAFVMSYSELQELFADAIIVMEK